MIAVRTGRHIEAASIDEVGKADEMSMMYENDASCTVYIACYITTPGTEQNLTVV